MHDLAFCSLSFSVWARAYYDKQKLKGHTHSEALRALSVGNHQKDTKTNQGGPKGKISKKTKKQIILILQETSQTNLP